MDKLLGRFFTMSLGLSYLDPIRLQSAKATSFFLVAIFHPFCSRPCSEPVVHGQGARGPQRWLCHSWGNDSVTIR